MRSIEGIILGISYAPQKKGIHDRMPFFYIKFYLMFGDFFNDFTVFDYCRIQFFDG
jgi:hypothetical protein